MKRSSIIAAVAVALVSCASLVVADEHATVKVSVEMEIRPKASAIARR